MTRYICRVFCAAAAILSQILITSCNGREEMATLAGVDSYIQERPDSALAVLRSIDTLKLHTGSARAKYSLLYAMALDKNYIDTTRVGIIAAAVNYYGKHGPAGDYAKSLYYRGLIQSNSKLYPQALVSFEDATDVAETVSDYNCLYRISIMQAVIYNRLYNNVAEIEYSKKAVGYSLEYGEREAIAQACYFLGTAQFNANEYDEAEDTFKCALDKFISEGDSLMSGKCFLSLASISLEWKENYTEALCYYRTAIDEYRVRLSDQDFGRYSYALFKAGDLGESRRLMNYVKSDVTREYWQYRIDADSGRYDEALKYLRRSITSQNDIVRQTLQESVTKEMKDYYREENLKKERDLAKTRVTVVSLSFIIFMMAFVTIAIIHIARKKESEQNLRLLDLSNSIDQIRKKHNSEIDEMRNNLRASYANHFSFIRDAITYNQDTGKLDAERAKEKMDALLDDIRRSSGKDSEFEKMIDAELGGCMTRLRKAMPKFTEEDYRLLSYVTVGFSPLLIAELLDRERQAVYLKKSRLCARIAKSGSEDADFLLDIIG